MKKIFTVIISLIMALATLVGCTNNGDTSGAASGKVSLLLSSSEKELYIDDTYTINYVVRNSDSKATFLSSNPSVASVNENGEVVALSAGETIIVVSAGSCVETCVITVKYAPTYRIWVANNDILLVKEGSFTVAAAVKKGSTVYGDANIVYRSTDESVFTVDEEGTLTAVDVGVAQLELSCAYDNKALSEFVDVSVSEEVLFHVEQSATVGWQESYNLNYYLTDFNGVKIDNAVADVTSSDTSVLTVSGNVLTAVGIGEASVTLSYAGAKVNVQVDCLYKPLELEYNAFRHEKIFEGIRSHQYFNLTNATMAYGTFSLTTENIGGNTDAKAKFLPLKPNGQPEKYLGIFVPCLQTKEALIQLQLQGYVNVTFKLYFDHFTVPTVDDQGVSDEAYITTHVTSDYSGRSETHIGTSVELSKIHGEKNNQQWLEFNIPIQEIVRNYDDLATGVKPLFKVISNSDKTNYVMYMTQIMFTKIN